jgi:hypothetical protein
MWCDTFDADLLAVVPGAAEALGDTAAVRLWTYSEVTGGVINCPASWDGAGALFWTAPRYRPSATYYTRSPIAACTFLEVVRDEWVHHSRVGVNGYPVWQPPARLMMQLMYDLRGWTPVPAASRRQLVSNAQASLLAAADRLRQVITRAGEETALADEACW